MSKWKAGDRVRVIDREVTPDDKKNNRYFDHMKGLVGTIQSVYDAEVAVKIDDDALSTVTKKIHKESTRRMRERFVGEATEEIKAKLTKEELDFQPNFMLLVHGEDLEKA